MNDSTQPGSETKSARQTTRLPHPGQALTGPLGKLHIAPTGSYQMSDLLTLVIGEGASDLHIRVGRPPTRRLHGDLVAVDGPVLKAEDTEALCQSIVGETKMVELKEDGQTDFSLKYANAEGVSARFRVSAFKQQGTYALVMRQIPEHIKTIEELFLPPQLTKLTALPRGLVLVVGPTGSGKSTTLAALIDHINESRSNAHILTLEDPIEFTHRSKKSVITQREVGTDTKSFESGLRVALRQDPDVILVGEMRDIESTRMALHAAETGHLVFSTLHTTGAARTVDRIINMFPEGEQQNVRTQLSEVLQGVVSQLLLPRIDTVGRVGMFEVMFRTDAIGNHIRTGNTGRIRDEIQMGSQHEMVSMDEYLLTAAETRIIDPALAVEKAHDKITMRARLQNLRAVA